MRKLIASIAGAAVDQLVVHRRADHPREAVVPEEVAGGPASGEHLLDRVGTVIRLAQDPRAKLQYFQTMFDFR